MKIDLKIKPLHKNFKMPAMMSSGAAGFDISATLDDDIVIKPGETALVSAGFSMSLPEGFEAQVRPRSGLALKHGITVLNSPGTIDHDYRGPIGVILINHGKADFVIENGMRVAQMVVKPTVNCNIELASDLDDTNRGMGGFGSTGV